MESDIVERLRAVLHNDRSVELMNREASAEIERLRAELAAAINERNGYLEGNRQTLRALAEANEIAARYKRQRDEARRMLCHEIAESGKSWRNPHCCGREHKDDVNARLVAEAFSWHCFKEGGGA